MDEVRPITRKRGQRGIAAFKKNYRPEEYNVKFNENNIPNGGMSTQFMSCFGINVQQRFPIDEDPGKVKDKYFEDLWLEAKKQWNIESDDMKDYMKRRAVKLASNFKSRLVSKFVNNELDACAAYTFIPRDVWDRFVTQKNYP
ncbi:unnamed protein product [Lactuca saligna]|uniref:Uncharacterized protein n=1 Tax=Lactuca saligna TaxID=75948 RepID=A0AA36A102_LACSI|nr:unnamed protein product [Lactuca saligna]